MQVKHRRTGAVAGNESVIGATSLVEVGEFNQGKNSTSRSAVYMTATLVMRFAM